MAVLALILPLVFIIYEDFTYRAIHWFWLLLMLVLVFFFFSWQQQFLAINALLVLLQMAALTLYFSIKHRKVVNIVNQYLGLGDVLFFLPLCFLFSPGNFVSFFMLSLMLSLLGHFVHQSFNRQKNGSIPLAAYMSLTLIAVLIGSEILNFDLYNDYWIRSLLRNSNTGH